MSCICHAEWLVSALDRKEMRLAAVACVTACWAMRYTNFWLSLCYFVLWVFPMLVWHGPFFYSASGEIWTMLVSWGSVIFDVKDILSELHERVLELQREFVFLKVQRCMNPMLSDDGTDVAHLLCWMDNSCKQLWVSYRAAHFSGLRDFIPARINVP